MSDLTIACTTCNTDVNQVFAPTTGTRLDQVISGDLFVTERCFVRDEIRFLNGGRLVFTPRLIRESKERRFEYFDSYYVICRRLTVIGGFKSVDNPDAPLNKRNNVITWKDRLQSAADGTTMVSNAADGQSFIGAWSDQGQGNDGKDGGAGQPGSKGNRGATGANAPRQVVVIALEVDVQPLSHLTVDWDGQDGGTGGRGQHGGKGGAPMPGRIGQSDTTWPGTGCDRQPGNGGNGGNGGDGGPGGDGGNGGDAGTIIVISTRDNILSGAFVNGNISYLNDGGAGGKGGGSGNGGAGHQVVFPNPGFPTSECSPAFSGQSGQAGVPFPAAPFDPNLDPNRGAPGTQGAGATAPNPQELQPGTCADLLPLPMEFDAGGFQPSHFCRGFSVPVNGDTSITGQNLAQANAVTASLAGVTPSIRFTSTDVQLDLHLQIAGNSGTGPCDLVFKRDFGPDQTVTSALTIGKFEVLSIAPPSGARGNAVSVTITGNCFDPSAILQQVLISGLLVNVLNVVVVDEHTVQCVLDIGNLAGLGTRDVTVKTGLFAHTLIGGFTIT